MEPIRVTGSRPTTIERGSLERARAAAAPAATTPKPVCTAPFVGLVVDAAGTASACVAAGRPLAAAADDLAAVFAAEDAAQLRSALQRGELPDDHCAACIAQLQIGLPQRAALVRRYAAAEVGTTRPERLVVRLELGRRGPEIDVLLGRIAPLLPTLRHVTVTCVDPTTDAWFGALLEWLHTRAPDLPLEVRLREMQQPERFAACLHGQALTACSIDARGDVEAVAGAVRALLPAAARIVVEHVLRPDDWFEVHALALRCAAVDADLVLRAATDDGAVPLLDLSLAEQRLVIGALGACWPLFVDDARPRSLPDGTFDELRAELRRHVERRATSSLYTDPEHLLAGSTALELPPFDHRGFDEASFAQALVSAVVGCPDRSALVRWASQAARHPDFPGRAAEQPALRLLLQLAAAAGVDAAITATLRDLYRSRTTSKQLLAEEQRFAAAAGVADAAGSTRRWLGLEQALLQRRRPWSRPKVEPGVAATEAADVTVLIPSYAHENFIEECVASVLSQTHARIAVLVVDDGSTDATVARARGIDDDRVEVRVNERNLGLANSVLGALPTITTPYVALLNSDDACHPERIARCREVLERDPDADVVATALALIDGDGAKLTPQNVSRLRDGPSIFDWVHWYEGVLADVRADDDVFGQLLQHNFLATSSNIFCRTDFLRSCAETLADLKYCLDWQVFLTAALHGRLRIIGERLTAYRLHGSNTVWFSGGGRWGYFLETNRVAVQALRAFVESRPGQGGGAAMLHLTERYVQANAEIDGFGALLNDLLGGRELEALAGSAPELRDVILDLSRRANRITRFLYAARAAEGELEARLWKLAELPNLEAAKLLAEVVTEEAACARHELRRAQDFGAAMQQLVEDWKAAYARVDAELASTWRRAENLLRERNTFEQDVAQLRVVETQLRDEMTRALAMLRVARDLTTRREAELLRAREELAALHADREAVSAAEREATPALDRLITARTQLVAALEPDIAREAAPPYEDIAAGPTSGVRHMQREVEWAGYSLRLARHEIERMRGSVEWRIGTLLWRKLPLFAKTRRAVRGVYRRLREASLRSVRFFERQVARRRQTASPIRVAAGSTATFPVISHTFVYQELTAMHEMLGADVKVFHTEHGDATALHAAFTYLDRNRELVQPAWEVHKADFDHYRRTRPEKLETLMAALVEASGLPREDIENRFEFLLAFTYARRHEAWGADYVHSYFFYDQALCALVSSWMNDLPRGLSTYADHMMADWPLKVTALHLRTADVIVATSRRIRDELIGIGGSEIAGKVVVKPNGVDGRRFRFVERTAVENRPIELVCVCRIEPKKGLLGLVEAARLLLDRQRRFRIHVIGTHDAGAAASEAYAERFEARIAELGVGEVVLRHGRMLQEEMQPLLAAADAFVAPFVETESGDKDGIPTAILEAIATGLPVVATTAGSIAEIIDDGVEGFLVPQRDPPALAAVIEKLIDDPGLAPRLGKAAKQRFDHEFDIRATEPRLHERIRAAIAERRRARPRGD